MIKLYLCSQSPRRKELLGEIHNNFMCLRLSSEEPRHNAKELPLGYLRRCVEHKFQGAEHELKKRFQSSSARAFLVADTIVVCQRQILGKPVDRKHAEETLKFLSGKKHRVWTGFAVGVLQGNSLAFKAIKQISSEIYFHRLSQREILAYLKSGDADDKAGAYGFQATALSFVKKVDGSYSNIMGLPLLEIKKVLAKINKEFE